jgi:CO/xanthine dehydrogenase Mo-binding subunit
MSGNAVKLAAEAVRYDLLQKATEVLGEKPQNLDMHDNEIFSTKNGNKRIPLSQVARATKAEGNPLEALRTFHAPATRTIPFGKLEGLIFPDYTFGSQAVEVEVNTMTGEVRVTKMVGAYDVGKAIHPGRVEGQIEGGMTHGLGYAIMENFVEDRGIPQTSNLTTYVIPTSKDTPDIRSIILESHSGKGPFGAKGIGEIPVVATTPAILSAIRDAVGIDIRKTPATAEAVFDALADG